ncbi:MAG: aldehyde ferredoxin oxidoreductase N-terminal domain-containing protein [Anaerolineae bacterium]
MTVSGSSTAVRRILVLRPHARDYRLRALSVAAVSQDPREDSLLLWGEALCHVLLRDDPSSLVIARGPLAFLPGNKATVGYVSPLTGLPHYSFVGGRGFAELLNLGLDAIVLADDTERPGGGIGERGLSDAYVVISGRAPDLEVAWRAADEMPHGQRSAYYWLVDNELGGQAELGSVFTVGTAAEYGYRAANLAVDGLYHAGRGGAGDRFSQGLRALVLHGQPMDIASWMGDRTSDFLRFREAEMAPRLTEACGRLSRRDGGTVTKLVTTGAGDHPTLPARNAQRVGYPLADLGARRVLTAHRVGQMGCQWCHVNCRHWHWVDVDYAPDGRDRYLDDFEPTYALFAMLDLVPEDDSLRGRIELIEAVDQRLVVPIEQMGIDVMETGVGIAALFEGLEQGIVPDDDVPPSLRARDGSRKRAYFGDLDCAAAAVSALAAGDDHPAIRALGDGLEALVGRYEGLRDRVFTSGPGTLANAGHANALWTFLMPFSRFFSHYSGQIYKLPGNLTPDMTSAEVHALFRDVVGLMLEREAFLVLGNALSACAFTFVVFSEDGEGQRLDGSGLLVRALSFYGLDVHELDLAWFARAFWAQSIVMKASYGWRPHRVDDYPDRVFEVLSPVLQRPVDNLKELMAQLIAEWRQQAGARLAQFGYEVPWQADG